MQSKLILKKLLCCCRGNSEKVEESGSQNNIEKYNIQSGEESEFKEDDDINNTFGNKSGSKMQNNSTLSISVSEVNAHPLANYVFPRVNTH